MKPIARMNCCIHCGARWPDPNAEWPRECGACRHENYRNPTPVAVVIASTDDGEVALTRRNIHPGFGDIALPGGYVNYGESCEKAGVRELWEELGIVADPADLQLLSVKDGGHVTLVFYELRRRVRKDEVVGVPNDETQEVVWTKRAVKLCFSTHTEALAEWFGAFVGTR